MSAPTVGRHAAQPRSDSGRAPMPRPSVISEPSASAPRITNAGFYLSDSPEHTRGNAASIAAAGPSRALYRTASLGVGITNGHGSTYGYPHEAAAMRNFPESLQGSDDVVAEEAVEADDDDLSTASGRRHGALLQPEDDDWLILDSPYMTHWNQKRHLTGGNPRARDERDVPDWRMRERLRTVTGALVMCLNIGVDPPDISKTNPCSKLICWMDPSSIEVSKALPAIGKNLQAQFETLSMKTRYKQYLDPIVEETKRFCTSLRRTAKDERVLFYYNGYGVPRPTPGGEIWVFNKAYTQYIPVTLYDLQAWLGNPCIFVWDASAAGNVVVNFQRMAERKAEEEAKANAKEKGNERAGAAKPAPSEPHFPLRESIHLAACAPDEILPMNPDLPADLFTCCLTSPIEISLRWFVLQNPLPSQLNVDMVMNIPGKLSDRRTPLGELNWIFTAITDTIAWTVLPRAIFRRLFRDDLMVAALLRNFLLAERIMRFYHCTPMSHPKLPPTHDHPLWDSWDLAVDQCLAQLPTLLAKERAQEEAANGGPPVPPHLASFEYRHSTFFSEQLKAFEVWLSQGGVSRKGRRRRVDASKMTVAEEYAAALDDDEDDDARPVRDPPDQLPIVLQVLLSQVHRLRALILLSQFLDLGPWAVNLALSIGIFPYVLKLLQSPAADLKPVLIYIWARILAVDRSCQNDLLRDNGFVYFLGMLNGGNGANGAANGGALAANPNALPIPNQNVSEHRAMCAFILGVFCQDFAAGQQACLETNAMESCLEHLEDDDFLLRQWSALCLAQLWDQSSPGKAKAVVEDAHGKLCCMLSDVAPEVRAAALYALGTFLGATGSSFDPLDPLTALPTTSSKASHARPLCLGTGYSTGLEESRQRGLEVGVAVTMLVTKGDCSPMVRKELVIALSPLVREYQGFFVLAAYLYYDREDRRLKRRESLSALSERAAASALEEEEGEDGDGEGDASEPLLRRVLSKLALEDGIDEVDISNVPAFTTIFVALLNLSADSYPEVANLASTCVDYISALMLESEVPRAGESSFFRFGPVDATNRLVTPTSTMPGADSYFPYTPKAGRFSDDVGGSGAGSGLSNGGGASGGMRSPTGPGSAPRRAPSLAQAVKTIATLGYSRPASPTGSPDWDNPNAVSSAVSRAASPHQLPPQIPAPKFNLAQYVSPYAGSPRAAGPSTPEASSHPASPAGGNPLLLPHHSASAESLAQIARLQERRGLRGSSTPGTPALGSSPLAERHRSATGRHQNAGAAGAESRSHSGTATEIKVADALANLISQDLQRFRDRAALASESIAGSGVPGAAGTSSAQSPSTSRGGASGFSTPQTPGAGPAGGVRETLPLKSRFFAWCSEYYTEPQMKHAEADEPGSIKYNVQTWKRQRNERLINEAQAEVEHASRSTWSEHIATMRNGAPPSSMLFHQFESHLITASEQDTISVWDWERAKLISRFHNGNPSKTNITSMTFVNEDVDAMLLVASAEGDVRIYSHYDRLMTIDGGGPKLASSFRALPDLVRSKRPSGLIVDWQQVTGHLLAGGDSRVVRIWDAHRELCVCDIPTRTSSCITSISSEVDVGHIFVAGFGDGTVGVYDRRNPPEASLVRLWEEHQSWVQNVRLQKRGNRELVSASVDGEVRVWDIRGRSSIARTNLSEKLKGRVSCMALHERAPIFAASSSPRPSRSGLAPQRISIMHLETMQPIGRNQPIVRNFAPTGTSQHQSHPGLLPPASEAPPSLFTPATGAIAFHPHHHMLGYAGPDQAGTISVIRAPLSHASGQDPVWDAENLSIPLPPAPVERPRSSLFGF